MRVILNLPTGINPKKVVRKLMGFQGENSD
jgi:hypothetical protein